MKRRRPAHLEAVAGAFASRTGEHCPESGWWFPAQRELGEAPSPARFISEGSVMPASNGAAALWLPARTRSVPGKFEEEGH